MFSPINRRSLLKTAGAAGIGTAIIGTRGMPMAAARQDQVTLTWWDYYDGANGEAMDKQIAAYTEAQPSVTIQRTYIPFADLKQKLLQGAAAGDLPDIVVIDNPDHQAFASLGILEDVTDRVAEWGEGGSYFEGPWASTMFEDRNYGIPDNSNCLVMWGNDDLMAAAGVQFPTSWDELTAAVEALTANDVYGLAMSGIKSEEGTSHFLPFLWQSGADIPTLDSEGSRRALQLWTDYVANGYMSKAMLNWKQSDVLGQFQNGRAALMVNGPWQIPVIRAEAPDLKWSVALLPTDQEAATNLGGENTAIIAGGANIDAAWEFMTWRQMPEQLKPYLLDAGKLPTRTDLAEDEAWTGDPVVNVFVEQLSTARPRAYGDKYPDISAAIQNAIQSAVSGETSVEDALSTAQGIITPLLPES